MLVGHILDYDYLDIGPQLGRSAMAMLPMRV
jgi:hypothetical protein